MSDLVKLYLNKSQNLIQSDYLPKIEICIDRISDEDIWWRPNPVSNSIGNLLLHLEGNIRQWIISAVGGATDIRQREREFNEPKPLAKSDLLDRLKNTVADAMKIISGINQEDLIKKRTVQGNEVNVFEAVYTVVQHFAMHTGQILYITKLRTGSDLSFYRVIDGKACPNW